MGCSTCSTTTKIGLPAGCKNNGSCATGGCGSKLDVYDWLANIQYIGARPEFPVIEVKFKGTRKEYYVNYHDIPLETGDLVVVESATSGWDAGHVSLQGELVRLQMKKNKVEDDPEMMRRIMRIATSADMERYDESKGLEQITMIKARTIASGLGLIMKISDVEYQGDRSKATFFYTAEGRVDFRELIKMLAREFKIKVEMRQIGLRQEAGRLGGIGSCGRELCCSTWLTDFHSVPTTAARYQNLFLNPLKLSGQCGRLKCCLNYELDVYAEALNEFPDESTILRTEKGNARVEKLDILKRVMWFRYEGGQDPKFYALDIDTVHQIIDLNERGINPPDLDEYQSEKETPFEAEPDFKDVVGEERLDRFDNNSRKKKRRNSDSRHGRREGRPQGESQDRGRRDTGTPKAVQQGQAQNPTSGNQRQESKPQKQQGDRRDNPNHPRNNAQQNGDDRRRDEKRNHFKSDGSNNRGGTHQNNNRNKNRRNNNRRPGENNQNNPGDQNTGA